MPNGSSQLPILPRFGDPTTQLQDFATKDYVDNKVMTSYAGTVTSVSVTTANGVSGTVANATTTPGISLTLNAITPVSAAYTGTGGNGFMSLLSQSATPAAPASGFVEFADATGRKSWRRASDGFVRTWDATITADRVYSLPDATTMIAGLAVAQTFSAANTFSSNATFSANGALSAPAVSFTGTPITGGSASTTVGLVKIGSGTSGGLSTSGTMLEIQAPAGFAGHLQNWGVNGTSYVTISATGAFVAFGSISSSAGGLTSSASGAIQFNGRGVLTSPAAGQIQLGAADAAAPVAQTLSVQSVVAGTTDTAGANFAIKGSAGTGTGAGGSILFQVAPAGSTGSSQNALVTSLTLASTGFVYIGNVGVNSPLLFPFSGATYSGYSSSGRGLSFYSNVSVVAGDDSFAFTGSAYSGTSGTHNHLRITKSFTPTSGTAVYNHLHLSPTINQTGGANGITRGIYVNPTLTAAADFRAIEVSAGDVVMPAGTTGMTSGFPHMPAAAGAPSGTPSSRTGNVPFYYDTTNNKLYVYNGAWKSVTLT